MPDASSLRARLRRSLLPAAAVLTIVVAWWQVLAGGPDLVTETFERDGVPLTWIAPSGADDLPAVVVVHGFSGSRQLMSSYARALAGAGYGVLLPDLPGHGANRAPLVRDGDGDALAAAVAVARSAAAARPEVDADRLALLGHSMGSGAVLRAGIDTPDAQRAVVAVSPTDAPVDARRPPNLLLLAGAREPRFVANAEELLARAGGPSDDLAAGTARRLTVVPGVEHVSILFSPTAHGHTAAWLAATTGGGAEPTTDRRLAWWAVHLVAWLVLWHRSARWLVPAVTRVVVTPVSRARGVAAALGGALAAVVVLAGLGRLVEVSTLGGMLLGPGLALWFGVAGGVWLALGARPARPEPVDLTGAALVVVVTSLAFGVLAHHVWLPWWPTPQRLTLLPVLAGLLLPWSLALATAMAGRRTAAALGWWALAGGTLLAGLGAAAVVVPGFGFVLLVLPLLPALLGVLLVAARPLGRPWAVGGGLAVSLAWIITVLFPVV